MNSNKKKGRVILGLTGGIGTGKSTAAAYITSKGFIHIDADEIGRELTKEGSPVLPLLDECFGGNETPIIKADGSLDRKALAHIVFSDPEEKKKLDDIMFEQIISRITKEIEDAPRQNILLDAPLLFESGLDRLCDKVILITCDLEKRLERVTGRDGATRDEVLARINSQMPDDEKAKRADVVIDNSGSLEQFYEELDMIFILMKTLTNTYNNTKMNKCLR